MPEPRHSTAAKLAVLETGLVTLTEKLTSFVSASDKYREDVAKESRDMRRDHAEEMAKIWGELRAQGERFNTALEKFGSKNAITWPLIVLTAGFVLTIVVTAAGLGHFFVETRVHQLEIRDDHLEKQAERQRDVQDQIRRDILEDLREKLHQAQAQAAQK